MTDWADETEAKLLDGVLARAGTLGWSAAAAAEAGRALGLSRGDLELLAPEGPRDLAALLSRRDDRTALAALDAADASALKVRQKIQAGVEARLEAAAAHGEAARRWAGFLAMPPNAALGLRLAWESADAIWRWAGDTATDENHYSKRTILSGVLIPAMTLRLNRGAEEAHAFVTRRIEDVMRFEKWKAGLPKPRDAAELAVAALTRLRYGRG